MASTINKKIAKYIRLINLAIAIYFNSHYINIVL